MGHEAPSVSRREGGAVTKGPAAVWWYLAFQGLRSFAIILLQSKEQNKQMKIRKKQPLTAPTQEVEPNRARGG